MDSVLKLLMGPWTTYILWVLDTNGAKRFGELKRLVPGISARMLTQRLRMLEEAQVIKRDYKPTIPPQVTYSLDQRGHELRAALAALNEVGARWTKREAREVRDNRENEAAALA